MDTIKRIIAERDYEARVRKNRFWAKVVIGTLGAAAFGVLVVMLTGCGAEFIHTAIEGTDGCETYLIRCNGDTAEICNADHSWDVIQKCPEFEPGVWMCCEFGGNVGCHKEEDCL